MLDVEFGDRKGLREGLKGDCSVDGEHFSSLRLDGATRRVRTMKYHLVYALYLITAVP